MKVIITGGGTGGHIYPALSLAKSLIKKRWEVLYIGSKRGLEKKIVPAEGLLFKEIDVAPLPRKITIKVFNSLMETTKGFFQARRLIKDYQPDLVVGTGGFVAGPVVLAASLSKIPTLIHEQNVYPGLTNRLLSLRVDRIALNFAEAERYFPRKARNKFKVSGNPIREIILKTSREEGLKRLKLKPAKKTLLVFGGSQGSMSINQAMLRVFKYFKDTPWIQIVHITGEENYKSILQGINKLGIDLNKNDNYKIKPYLKSMEWAYAIADLIIYRAGATGLAEITAKGVPAILIPYPYAAGNHQEYNARNLEKNGAAIVIPDHDLTGEILIKEINYLFQNEEGLTQMKQKSLKLGRPEARENLVKLVEELVGK